MRNSGYEPMSGTETSLAPKDNAFLLGHEEAEKMFLTAWQKNSLHQAWLISGLKGIGKATFAYKVARFLLSADENRRDSYTSLDVAADSPVFRQISGGSQPDFKLLERGYLKTERQKIAKAIRDGNYMSEEELGELKKSGVIAVDDVRLINEFLAKKSANGCWRVVLIDSVDEMNTASANAILKILEEPPHKTLMLLVSHNPSRLLPTIRSRCAKLELKPLQDNIVASLLRRYRPEVSESEVKKITAIAGGSIGKAIDYADGNAAVYYDRICALAATGRNFAAADMLKFCDEAVETDKNYDLFKELLLKYLSDKVRAFQQIEAHAEAFDKATKIFAETDNLNLDKRLAVMNVMTSVCRECLG